MTAHTINPFEDDDTTIRPAAIAEARHVRGHTQAELGAALDPADPYLWKTVQSWELGKRKPGRRESAKLLRYIQHTNELIERKAKGE